MTKQVLPEGSSADQWLIEAALDEGTGSHQCPVTVDPGQTLCPSKTFLTPVLGPRVPERETGQTRGRRCLLTRFSRSEFGGGEGEPRGPRGGSVGPGAGPGLRGAGSGSSNLPPPGGVAPTRTSYALLSSPWRPRYLSENADAGHENSGKGYGRGARAQPPDAGTPLAGGWGRGVWARPAGLHAGNQRAPGNVQSLRVGGWVLSDIAKPQSCDTVHPNPQ